MEALLEEAPALLISIALLVGIIVASALNIPGASSLLPIIFTGVLTFWIGSSTTRTVSRQMLPSLRAAAMPPAQEPPHEEAHA